MGSFTQKILWSHSTLTSMKTLVFLLGCGLTLGSPVVLDTPEVVAAKEEFAAAFKAAELGEHAKLAPVNTDVQEAAPVFAGEQIPEAFLADTADVAEAKASFKSAFDSAAAGGLAAKQVAAPEFSGVQVPTAYLADTVDVAEAKESFMAAFDDAAAGGLAAKQAPAPAVPEVAPVAAVKSAAVVATPSVYAHTYPYTYPVVTALNAVPKVVSAPAVTYTMPKVATAPITYTVPKTVPQVVSYSSLTHPSVLPLYTHGLPYAGFLPLVQPQPLVDNSVEESAVETA